MHFIRPHLNRNLVLLAVMIPALGVFSGCGFVYPPPAIPDVVKKEVFHQGEPIALLSFEPGRKSGKIFGVLHGWPFPHVEGREGIATGTFTYVGEFKVTARSDEDSMPTEATGTRKVYFHEQNPQLSFADPHGYGLGQEVATDEMSMSFSFKDNHRIAAVRMITHQKSAREFSYHGQTIHPPQDRDTADTLEGEYSPDYGGYVLSSLNE